MKFYRQSGCNFVKAQKQDHKPTHEKGGWKEMFAVRHCSILDTGLRGGSVLALTVCILRFTANDLCSSFIQEL